MNIFAQDLRSNVQLCEVLFVQKYFFQMYQKFSLFVLAALSTKKHDEREPGNFKTEFSCTEMSCFCSKTYCCYDVGFFKFLFSSIGLSRRILDQSGDGPVEKHRRGLKEKVKITSTKRGFRTQSHAVATYQQTREGLPSLYPKRLVDVDAIRTIFLHL